MTPRRAVPPPIPGGWRDWLRDAPLGLVNVAVHGALRLLPVEAVTAVGSWLGRRLVPRLQAMRLARAGEHLRVLRPDLVDNPAALRRMAGSLGAVHAEFAMLERLGPAGRVEVEGAAALQAARAAGRPILIAGLHVTNWEVLPAALARLGLPCAMIYAPPRNRFTHRLAIRVRSRLGTRCVPPDRLAAREALRVLRAGEECMLIFVDEFSGGRVQAPRLGRTATQTGNIGLACRLAAMTGALVFPGHVERLPAGRFRVVLAPPLEFSDAAPLEARVAALEARLAPVILRFLPDWYFLLLLRRDR
ncbi:lysophospholipid acyltransferase family protein [Roseomonas sp. 18066]|uniref:lysophospholipid acyltransferase family protein n=1 Tax=Roseomonas sp. 18066 TaxID=2681412 RepID=UPI0013582872|nr:lysophospholipid acyltransferase family protein [Roseomonas sp. 18066]